MGIGDERYVSTTTYRRSGEPIATPTWITGLPDGRLGFWTSSGTSKYKRLRHDPRIVLQPSDSNGKVAPGAPSVEGTAELLQSGPLWDDVHRRILAKYGRLNLLGTRFINWVTHIGKGSFPFADIVIVVTPSPAGGHSSADRPTVGPA